MVGKPLPTSFNRDVPQHVVQKILDHDSPQMTAHYARLSDKTVITAAEANGHARVAEMNRQVAGNLDKIITALQTGSRDGREAAACDLGAGERREREREHAPSRQPRPALRPGHAHVLLARALITARNHPGHAVTALEAGSACALMPQARRTRPPRFAARPRTRPRSHQPCDARSPRREAAWIQAALLAVAMPTTMRRPT